MPPEKGKNKKTELKSKGSIAMRKKQAYCLFCFQKQKGVV